MLGGGFLYYFSLSLFGFSSHLSCWFLCHLIQLLPGGHSSLILALSWSLETEMSTSSPKQPGRSWAWCSWAPWDKILKHQVTLITWCLLISHPARVGQIQILVWVETVYEVNFFAKVLFWKQNLLWENWENVKPALSVFSLSYLS